MTCSSATDPGAASNAPAALEARADLVARAALEAAAVEAPAARTGSRSTSGRLARPSAGRCRVLGQPSYFALLAAATMLLVGLGGCLSLEDDLYSDCWREADGASGAPAFTPTPIDRSANPEAAYEAMGFDGTHWPDLHGAHITILDHGAFDFAFGAAKPLFEQLTNATVTNHAAQDAGTALELAARDIATGGHSFDILYGIDNALMSRAMDADVFSPYTPLLASDIEPEYRFVPRIGGAWAATPVDVGYIAINVDAREESVDGLDRLVARAGGFVTQDPRFSSPGLGFLVTTVATYGEACYLGYWEDLFEGGLTVTSGWTEAYVNRFSGGYGQFEEGSRSDKPIVTSYTTSPAYEMFYGYDEQNHVLTADHATFQQVQTMGILKNTQQRAAAEAWIEFTLTPAFQNLAAEYNAIYPAVRNTATEPSVEAVYGGRDPAPGTFVPASLTADQIGARVDVWVAEWADLYDAKRA